MGSGCLMQHTKGLCDAIQHYKDLLLWKACVYYENGRGNIACVDMSHLSLLSMEWGMVVRDLQL